MRSNVDCHAAYFSQCILNVTHHHKKLQVLDILIGMQAPVPPLQVFATLPLPRPNRAPILSLQAGQLTLSSAMAASASSPWILALLCMPSSRPSTSTTLCLAAATCRDMTREIWHLRTQCSALQSMQEVFWILIVKTLDERGCYICFEGLSTT